MRVTSGYRTPEHNRRVSRTGYEGPHTTGRAVDVAAFGERALRIVRIALAHGFSAPWKGAVPRWVRTPPGNSRSSR